MSANTNDYLDVAEYRSPAAVAGGAAGLAAFTHANGQFYFACRDAAGAVLLRSEGYPTKAARDNGMKSVERNRGTVDRYGVVAEGGAHFVVLKAGNHQEIGRSGPCASEADARALIAQLAGGATAAAGKPAKAAAKPARQPLAKGLRVTQLGSTYGELRNIIASVKGLGLRRRHHSVIVADTRENRGMINAATHLLKVEEVA